MASVINPPPIKAMKDLPYVLQEYIRQLYQVVAQGVGTILWTSINKAGADLTDIPTRLHNSLQSIQGGSSGNYFHLTRALEANKVFDFPNTGAVAVSTTTVTVTGAVLGDQVMVTPSTQLEAGINIYGYVSATNTVTIVANNSTAGAIDPASRTYYVLVIKV